MSELNSLLNSLPVEQISGLLGVSPDEARRAIDAALPSLIGGMQANAEDESGAASLAEALGAHANSTLLDDGIDAEAIDTEDGAKIAHHVFGDNEEAVAEKVALFGGTSTSLIQKLLPILAPIAMAWIGKQVFSQQAAPARQTTTKADSPLDDLQDMLTGNNRSTPAREEVGGIDLGSILGGLLGGGRSSSQSSGGFGDLLGSLGGLLGGGRR